ncbi:MAG: hypothetical protein JST75_21840 [Bacteroidetes bacterium]|nr:hypothetical protein [Bacteroidota bacterium]
MKGIIIYKGKYGATHQYADMLGSELHLPVVMIDHLEEKNLSQYDYIIIGSSVYEGQMQIKNWLRINLGSLLNKKLFFFIVCGTPADKTDEVNKIMKKNIPAEIRKPSTTFFLKGRMIKKNLSGWDRFMLKVGARLTKDLEQRKRMLTDFDEVKKENLIPLFLSVHTYNKGNLDIIINMERAI